MSLKPFKIWLDEILIKSNIQLSNVFQVCDSKGICSKMTYGTVVSYFWILPKYEQEQVRKSIQEIDSWGGNLKVYLRKFGQERII